MLRTSSFKPETMVYSDALPMLAPQYEIRHTKEGRLYYLNHTTKSTVRDSRDLEISRSIDLGTHSDSCASVMGGS